MILYAELTDIINMELVEALAIAFKVLFLALAFVAIFRIPVILIKEEIDFRKSKEKDEGISDIKPEKTKSLEEEYRREKITSYVEKMSLGEVMQLIPEGILKNIPKKRDILNETLINEIMCGKIEFREDESIHYVASDRILENDRDYYIEGIKEKKDDLLHFESIRKNNGIAVSMPAFGRERLLDGDESIWTMLAKDLEKSQDKTEREVLDTLNIEEEPEEEIDKNIKVLINQDAWKDYLETPSFDHDPWFDHNKIIPDINKDTDSVDNFSEKLPENDDKTTFNDKIIDALKLLPTKENLPHFIMLLNEYNLLDFDTKCNLGRKYISELEALKNKAERSAT